MTEKLSPEVHVSRSKMLCCMIAVFLGTTASMRPAQLVLPVMSESAEGAANLTGPLANSDLTFQWLYGESQLAAVPAGSVLTAIGFRLDTGQSSQPGVDHVFSSWDLQLSSSTNTAGALDPVFENNIGADAVTVRSGPYALGAGSLQGGAGPNAFFFIPFTTSYAYAGGDLLLTLRQNASSGLPFLVLDAVSLADLTGVADSVRGGGASAVSGQAQFSNVPVTALQHTPIPEPGSLFLIVPAIVLAGCVRLRRGARPCSRPCGCVTGL